MVFSITTPGGNRILLDPGREATDYPLDAILDSLPGGNRPLDLVIPTRPTSGRPQGNGRPQGSAPTDPRPLISDLLPGSTIALDADLTLTLLNVPTDPPDSLLFLLRYGDFTTLLPFENTQESQRAVLDHLPDTLTL